MANNSQVANQNPGKNKTFVKGMMIELKKVIWPTKDELINNEIVVVGFTLIASFAIWIFDFGFDTIIRYLIRM